jgi:ligand-binding sensor domain-containing protein/serine phosphatase RsbU (regulator of sigma subunit)
LKRINKYIFFLLLACFSCNSPEQKNDDEPQDKVIAVESKGIAVSPDSIKAPNVKPFGVPKLLSVVEDEKIPYIDNVHPLVTTPDTEELSDAYIVKHSTPIKVKPTIVPALSRTLTCIVPEPISVSPLRFRDYANCNIQYIDITQGFPTSNLIVAAEDRENNLWITCGHGLFRYNGRSYTDFAAKNELLKGVRPLIKSDKDENLWFALGSKGLLQYDGNRFTVYDTLSGISKLGAWSMDLEDKKNLWLRTKDGIAYFDGKNFTIYTTENGLPSNNITGLVCGKDKKLWVGTTDTGMVCFDGKSFITYHKPSGLMPRSILSMAEDTKGNIWMCGNDIVTKLNERTLTRYTVSDGFINGTIRKMMGDSKGNMWFTHYRGGMSCFDGKDFKWFTENEGVPVKTVFSLYEDKNGNIWAGTEGGGAIKYTSRSFKHISPKEGLKGIMMSVGQDTRGNTWMGSYDDGLSRFNGKEIIHVGPNKLFTAVIAMLNDSKGNMWFVPGGNAVTKFDGKNYFYFSTDCGSFSNDLCTVFEDSEGNIWFGSRADGAIKFDGRQFIQYKKDQGLNSNYITDIAQDSKGNMWFATTEGLNKMSDKTILSFRTEQGLLRNSIKNIAIDHNDNVWIGTDGDGLNFYDGKNMVTLTKDDGLCDNTIRSIIVDTKANTRAGYSSVWLSTDNGIAHIEAKANPYVLSDVLITNHFKQDGLLGLDFTSNSGFMDPQGRAWWGSIKGVTTLNTNELYIDSTIPKVHLQNVSLEQTPVDFNSLKDSIDRKKDWFIGDKKDMNLADLKFSGVVPFSNYPKDLELPYNINNITFNYAAINWLNGHKIRYMYFLEGADNYWHPVTSDNKAVYTNLDHGNYTFKVKAKGVSGVWSSPLEYKFVIHPPWWQTKIAYALYVIALISAVLLFINVRTRALRNRQKELEHIIVERTADVVNEKTKVEEKNKIIEDKQKEILDSINYAEKIQRTLLANHEFVNQTIPDSFVFFNPKDIVSGDFYWATKVMSDETFDVFGSDKKKQKVTKRELFYLAVCDSTGHGVPGAFMSLLNISFLNEAINEKNIHDPSRVFDFVRQRLIENMSAGGRRDGMDGILVCFDTSNQLIYYVGSNNAPVVISDGELKNLPTDKMPVGLGENMEPFKLFEINYKKGDMLHLFTDGYADQFGGPQGKKLKYKQLNQLLVDIFPLPLPEQEEILIKKFNDWKGELEQVDDVCILGVRL